MLFVVAVMPQNRLTCLLCQRYSNRMGCWFQQCCWNVGAVADDYNNRRLSHQVLAAEPLVFLAVSTPPPPAFSAERSTVDPIQQAGTCHDVLYHG